MYRKLIREAWRLAEANKYQELTLEERAKNTARIYEILQALFELFFAGGMPRESTIVGLLERGQVRQAISMLEESIVLKI